MPPIPERDLKKLRSDLALILKECDARDQTLAILQANLTLALDRAKAVVTEGEISRVRLAELEQQCRKFQHDQNNARTFYITTSDYLDRVEASADDKKGGTA